MNFVDIHIHALFNTDDGPSTEDEMQKLIDTAYADGTRVMCLTPHYHPGFFGETRQNSEYAFKKLQEYIANKHPDMNLYIGNELRYSPEAVEWLSKGDCRTINGTDYVLVDFSSAEDQKKILRGLERLLNAGYVPILAHVERYFDLSKSSIRELTYKGVWLQLDAQSLFGNYGLRAKLRAKWLLRMKLADIVATDAHDSLQRKPELAKAYRYTKKYGHTYADILFKENPMRILHGKTREENL